MNMILGTGENALVCALEVSRSVCVETDASMSVGRDTLLYAVCRFLRHSKSLCGKYVWMSYRMRLASGRARKPQRCRFVAPAPLLELSAGWVEAEVSVSPVGVTVERVALLSEFPTGTANRRWW